MLAASEAETEEEEGGGRGGKIHFWRVAEWICGNFGLGWGSGGVELLGRWVWHGGVERE